MLETNKISEHYSGFRKAKRLPLGDARESFG
jgi:hypothetical protein